MDVRDVPSDVLIRTDAGDAATDASEDAGPQGPCVGLTYTGTLSPRFDPDADGARHTLTVPFAQLRARLTRVDSSGRPCLDQPTDAGIFRRFDDGSFIPVDGATLEYEDVVITIEIEAPRYRDVFALGTHAETRFGAALSTENNRVAVGAPTDAHAQMGVNDAPAGPAEMSTGAVHIYDVVEDDSGTERSFERVNFIKSNEAPFEDARFGEHVHLNDGYLAVSAPDYNTDDTEYGRIHVYRSGPWQPLGVIERPTSLGRMRYAQTKDGFVFVALPQLDTDGGVAGRIRVHSHAADEWTTAYDIGRDDLVADDQFGAMFVLAGDVMLVQANQPEPVLHLYRRDDVGWDAVAVLSLTSAASLFATDGSFAVVTDETQTTLYSLEGNAFDRLGALQNPELNPVRSVAVRDGRIAVGLPNPNAVGPGLVITAHLAVDDSNLMLVPTSIQNPTNGAQFGGALAFTQSAGLVVGAPLQTSTGRPFGHGAVFLYE